MNYDEANRIGVSIKRYGTWRETVVRYASYKGLIAAAVTRFDVLVAEGFAEPWAALRAIDEHCCADILVDNSSSGIERVRSVN